MFGLPYFIVNELIFVLYKFSDELAIIWEKTWCPII